MMRLVKIAHEHRELSESKQLHLDQARMCFAFEAFQYGHEIKAEKLFRLEIPRTHASNPAAAAREAKARHMNV